ncbi:LGFP repeat-containing protein, partial [Clostridioides difficile]
MSAGCTQRFVGGLIASGGDHAEVVPEPIATKYLALGGPAAVGGPVAPAVCDSGACNQRFSAARIDSSPRGVIATTKWFFDAWASTGFEKGRLGLPQAEMTCIPATCYQPFAGGTL